MKLHELSEQYNGIQDEDLPDEVIADTLEGIEGEIQTKGENIALLIQNLESDEEQIDLYIKQLQARKKAIARRIEEIKNYMRENMEATGIKSIKCPLFSISCVKGRAMVEIYDEQALPDEYVSVQVITKPDKKKILDALKAGEEISGAKLTETKSSIRIK